VKWFAKRMSENSSKVAVGTAVAAVAGLATGQIDPTAAITALLPALLHFLVPNNAAS
jgi:hypothetical protein